MMQNYFGYASKYPICEDQDYKNVFMVSDSTFSTITNKTSLGAHFIKGNWEMHEKFAEDDFNLVSCRYEGGALTVKLVYSVFNFLRLKFCPMNLDSSH